MTNIKRGPILLALIVGSVISLLNETLINVALTTFMKDFNVPATTAQWLSTGFMLITGILVPVTAFVLEWLTTKQVFLGSLAIFSAGTIIAGSASSFSMLLAGRFIQAIGTGAMVPLMVNTTLQITPAKKHGAAMGLCMLVMLTAPAIAPTLAGIILTFASWRWLFFSLIPFVILAALLASRFLNLPRELSRPKLDILSVVLSTLGFGSFIYGVSSGGAVGISGAIIPLCIGIICLGLFVWRELSIPNPMLNLTPFTHFQFSLGMVLVFVLMMGAFACLLLLPIYFQTALVITPLIAGLAMLPGGLLNGLCAPLAGKLYDRFGARRIAPAGLAIFALGLAVSAYMIGKTNSPWPALLIYMVMMAGMPFSITPAQTNSLSGLPRELYPHGAAIMNTLQMIAASFGSSLFIGIMSSRQAALLSADVLPREALIRGIKLSFRVGALIMAAAFIASLFLGSGANKRPPSTEEA